MAHAREVKTAKSKAKRETDDLINLIVKYCHDEGYPLVEVKDIGFSGDMPIIAVWDEGHRKARMHTIPQLEYDKLRATHR